MARIKAGKLLGEPKLPPKVVRALFLLFIQTSCFSCVVCSVRLPAAGRALKSRAKSKRITLEADAVRIIPALPGTGAASGQFCCSLA